MRRIADSSGARYSVHKEQARKFEPIAPVGTSYTPIGRVNVDELRRGAPQDVIGRVVRMDNQLDNATTHVCVCS